LDNQRNLLLAVLLSGLLILGWDVGMRFLYPEASLTAPMDTAKPSAQTSAGSVPGTSVVAGDLGGDATMAQKVDLSAALASRGWRARSTLSARGSTTLF
jgi:YidC/Oxa1 family membrane protein insertase